MWEETGIKPQALVDKPALIERWNIPYQVWLELSNSRNYTAGGPAGIPFSEFYMWSKVHNYTNSEAACMWEDISQVDKTWLTETSSRAKEERDRAAAAAKSKKGTARL